MPQEYEVHSEQVSYPSAGPDDLVQGLFGKMDTTPTSSTSSHNLTPIYSNSSSNALPGEQGRHDAEDSVDLGAKSDGMISLAKHSFLFDHYMDHACRHLDPISVYARKVGLPRLAAEHQGVLGSIMAVGAACLCLDLLLDQATSGHEGNVDDLIRIGDHYHQLGLQNVRHQMMLNRPKDITEAYAHSILLWPYAMAKKRISDLLGNRDPSRSGTGLHLESPADAELGDCPPRHLDYWKSILGCQLQ